MTYLFRGSALKNLYLLILAICSMAMSSKAFSWSLFNTKEEGKDTRVVYLAVDKNNKIGWIREDFKTPHRLTLSNNFGMDTDEELTISYWILPLKFDCKNRVAKFLPTMKFNKENQIIEYSSSEEYEFIPKVGTSPYELQRRICNN